MSVIVRHISTTQIADALVVAGTTVRTPRGTHPAHSGPARPGIGRRRLLRVRANPARQHHPERHTGLVYDPGSEFTWYWRGRGGLSMSGAPAVKPGGVSPAVSPTAPSRSRSGWYPVATLPGRGQPWWPAGGLSPMCRRRAGGAEGVPQAGQVNGEPCLLGHQSQERAHRFERGEDFAADLLGGTHRIHRNQDPAATSAGRSSQAGSAGGSGISHHDQDIRIMSPELSIA